VWIVVGIASVVAAASSSTGNAKMDETRLVAVALGAALGESFGSVEYLGDVAFRRLQCRRGGWTDDICTIA
jgi:hypothetical protein